MNWLEVKPHERLKPHRSPMGSSQIALIFVLAVGLFLAVYFGLLIGQGERQKTYLLLLLIVAFPVLLVFGSNYWVPIPFAINCGLPAIPIVAGRSMELGEAWVMACAVAMLLRMPLSSRRIVLLRMFTVPVYLYAAWALLVFKMNPVGLAILGSSNVGFRFYMKIGLAFISFFIIMNQDLTEKRCKWLIFLIIAAGVAYMAYAIPMAILGYRASVEEGASETFYTWHQMLIVLPMPLLVFIFSKWSVGEIFAHARIRLIPLIGICYAMILFSGKRRALAVALLYPAFGYIARRKYSQVFFVSALGAIALATIAFSQGRIVNFPLTVQRAVAFVPGNWAPEVRRSADNIFRETLNELALDAIRERPWISHGYGLSSSSVRNFEALAGRLTQQHYAAYLAAASSSWHNTWLGISADFGIPAAVIFALFLIMLLRTSWWVIRRTELRSYSNILATMIFIFTMESVLGSWVGGHSAYAYWNSCWMFGIVAGLRIRIEDEAAARGGVKLPPKSLAAGRAQPPAPMAVR
ncbi:MAG: O-antigen ligase family protein [Verrucomicrobiales bacterium]